MTVKGQAPCLAVAPSWSSGALEELPPRRREVTLLVSDLAGLGDDEGWWRPDGLAEIVDHYLRDVVRIAGDGAGIVPSLLGTRLWIIFGAFVDRDDAPVAAVRVAAEIRARSTELSRAARKRGIAVDCRARSALATGPCLVGSFAPGGLSTYTAIGPASAEVASLHARATPGSIVCDERTWAAIQDRARAGADRGLQGLVTVVSRLEGPAVAAQGHASDAHPGRMFRREGDFWAVAYQGPVFRLRDSKGLLYLARLLAQPHTEIHSQELAAELPSGAAGLAGPRTEWASLGHAARDLGDAGAVLDHRAKVAYRSRLGELREQLEHEDLLVDPERRMRLESEMDALTRQLASAVGLGGRDRRAAAVSERARVNVTRAIRAAVSRIASRDRELGAHLSTSVSTGTFCSYNPRPTTGPMEGWSLSYQIVA